MRQIRIDIKPDYAAYGLDYQGKATLTLMIHDSQPERVFPTLICVPGGCYSRCSKREGEPPAVRFYSYGYNAAVLEYSVIDKPFPTALLELCEAVKYIRSHKEELCATDDVTVMGFSAGGHLAASLGVYSQKYGGIAVRPDRLILCYPVITSGVYTHRESAENIARDSDTMDLISLEKHISDSFPPCFIWHCADDSTVPVQNSLLLAQSLSENNIPYELHIFPEGGHGIAMCDITTVRDGDYDKYINPTCAQWSELALDWLRRTSI